jgi:hypothetical protein
MVAGVRISSAQWRRNLIVTGLPAALTRSVGPERRNRTTRFGAATNR